MGVRFTLIFGFLCALGCEYGPAHLPALRNLQAAHEENARRVGRIIWDLEDEHNLPHSPSALDQEIDAHEETREELAEVRAELEAYKAELEDLLAVEHLLEQLGPEQKMQWLLQRQQLALERKRMENERHLQSARLSSEEKQIRSELRSTRRQLRQSRLREALLSVPPPPEMLPKTQNLHVYHH